MTSEVLLTVRDVAKMLNMKEPTLHRRVWAGEDVPPYFRLGRSIRFREQDVRVWLESHRVESCTDKKVA